MDGILLWRRRGSRFCLSPGEDEGVIVDHVECK